MTVQSEAVLEKKLIEQLVSQGYETVQINDETELNSNFRRQLELHNKIKLTDDEFDRILTHLDGGSVFAKAKKLRDKYALKREKEVIYIEFFNIKEWCKNIFQVTNQITMEGKYKNRYDVTILINGLPLVQVELKRRGIELKKAFNQIKRYQKHSYGNLFHYVQIFIVSNGVDTKYFANNREQTFKHTFFWTDRSNIKFSMLDKFTEEFLEKCHISKMIARYIVLQEADKVLMVLRPYQYYAVESIVKRTVNTSGNGYVWHTTGSGKTLTSFKASQILIENENIDKVIFVVDRKDLDYQTFKEFNSFCKDCVDSTDNTRSFVRQMNDTNKLIVTTIQKLTRAVDNERFSAKLDKFKDRKIVFIFDECHRSQFGEMHSKITSYFNSIQLFGFTGTPIFADNAQNFKTTDDVFGSCLHKYLIKDAINDENVLGFSVEYLGRYKDKSSIDIDVEAIDTKEVMDSDMRLGKITDYIIANHDRKTHAKEFNSIFTVSSIDVLAKYYKMFKEKQHNLKIATIFSFEDNEEVKASRKHARECLEESINDYNKQFGTDYSTHKFQGYYIDIAKRVKDKQVDILLVVNMFLTGFDSKYTNTLYVDKNLKYHTLIQAFSRTNRICGEKKTFGNIVSFRNLKDDTDKAIILYSNEDALTTVLMKSYQEYIDIFNDNISELFKIAPSLQSIDQYQTEEQKAEFVKAFRNLMRVLTRILVFTEFEWNDLNIDEQKFEDYKSKYLDIFESIKEKKEKVSILDDIDFEIELLKHDIVNATYIIMLLKELDPTDKSYEKDKNFILRTLDSSPELKSKRELIEIFIEKNLPYIRNRDDIEGELDAHLGSEKDKALNQFIAAENLKNDIIQNVIEDYEFSGKIDDAEIKKSFNETLKFKEKRVKVKTVREKIVELIEKFTLF
jgi:type I restriction enzyme, R subunit